MLQNIGWVQLLILLIIVMLVFGTKRIKNLGSDLGSAVKGFRKGMSDEEEAAGDGDTVEQIAAEPNTESASEPADSKTKS